MKPSLAILVVATCLACLIHAKPTENEKPVKEGQQDSSSSEASEDDPSYEDDYWEDFLDELNVIPETEDDESDEEEENLPPFGVTSFFPPTPPQDSDENRNDNDGFGGDYQLTLTPSNSSKKQYKMMKQMTMLLRKNLKPCPENFFFYEDKCYRISTFKATKQRSGGFCRSLGAKLTTIPSKAFLLRLIWEFADHPGFNDSTELLFWTSAELRDKTWYWAGTSDRVNFGKNRKRRQLRTTSHTGRNNQLSKDFSLLVTIANTLDQAIMRAVPLKDEDKNYFICEMPACNSTKGKDGKDEHKNEHKPRYGDHGSHGGHGNYGSHGGHGNHGSHGGHGNHGSHGHHGSHGNHNSHENDKDMGENKPQDDQEKDTSNDPVNPDSHKEPPKTEEAQQEPDDLNSMEEQENPDDMEPPRAGIMQG